MTGRARGARRGRPREARDRAPPLSQLPHLPLHYGLFCEDCGTVPRSYGRVEEGSELRQRCHASSIAGGRLEAATSTMPAAMCTDL
eukprot:923065-Alexandrium_andersonii.AAC.1